jgi:hypothetical protein
MEEICGKLGAFQHLEREKGVNALKEAVKKGPFLQLQHVKGVQQELTSAGPYITTQLQECAFIVQRPSLQRGHKSRMSC